MTLTFLLSALAVGIAVLAVAADRSARASAWRQIALERRWNHEQRRLSAGRAGGPGRVPRGNGAG